ncbi:DNA repair protein rad50 [Sphaceloma murrayae]|uniref:DNA repair protein RAD50 n=1 Tax=Sphaceloma murrayae TaxID=2082308 RepID=A0A2K1QJ32_9PEZI|nr:DNA repair protein rad50 [Sphaceloma murrayae]
MWVATSAKPKIDKLSILGIRSFSPKTCEVIEFLTPLTLIVGFNGSGKTTIIECLKYATTGEMPEGAKVGGAWIHDPKLTGERETLGQVRLSFRNGKGERMILNRNVSLTVTRNSRSFKALETTLVRKKINGERESISSRVAQINELVPDLLGVSKAVLENVIFCHQENSLWPMSPPNDLKKKFDDIFEAVKYTQAVENIRKLRKEYADKLKVLKVEEINSKQYKDKGVKVEQESHDLYEQLEQGRAVQSELEEAGRLIDAQYEECIGNISRLSTLHGDLKGKRIQYQTKLESVKKIERNIKPLSESDQELQQMLDDFESRVEELKALSEEHRKEYNELASQTQKTRSSLLTKERELGALNAQKENYERQLEVREKLVKEIARSHSIRGFDLDVDEEQVAAFREKMTALKKSQTQELERARKKANEELQKAQAVLSGINERKTGFVQRKEAARSAITTNDRRIARLQSDYDLIEVDEGAKAALESSINDSQNRLRDVKSSWETAGWEERLRQINSEITSLDEKKERLDAELAEGAKRAGEVARLEYLYKEVRDGEASLQSMTNTHGTKITSLINAEWTISDLDHDFQKTLHAKNTAVTEAERQRDGVSNELAQINYKLSDCRRELKKKHTQAVELRKTIRDTLGADVSEFKVRLVEVEKENDTVMNNTSASESMIDYFEKSMKTAEEHHACRLCARTFENQSEELRKFVARLQRNIKGVQEKNDAQEAEEVQAELKSLRGLVPSYETWERLSESEIPNLEKEEKRLQSQKDELDTEIERHDSIVGDRQSERVDVESLASIVKSMVKYHTDTTGHLQQIKVLESKQSNPGRFRTLDQINDDIKAVAETSRGARGSLNKVTTDRDRARSAITNLELELRDLGSKLESTNYKLKEKLSLQSQVNDAKQSNAEHRESLRAADEAMQSLGPELGQAQSVYDEASRQGSEKDHQLRERIAALDRSLNQLEVAEQGIKSYHDRDGPAQIHRAQHSIESMKSEIQSIEQKMTGITKKANNIENQLRNNEDTKRNIGDNLDYRRDKLDVEKVSREIEDLESRNVEADQQEYTEQKAHLEAERLKNNAAQSRLVGQLQEKDDRLAKNLADWETDYKDAARKYKEAHIRVETTKAAVEDLGRYGSALENAVMKYHSLKMEEVNRIIDELWRRTYQGTDVDTIIIKSENESLKGGRSYKYRVCMVKQDAEMDMRGRCSAGQKVLASIIIRLALAECFGVNCGLIALDEPTTNLDRDNIQALARGLSEIIRVRRQQSNFQLIVITHDEEFLRYMQCSDYADEYYRVSRDHKQDTEITKQSIGYVMN